jgi:glycogen(starch) synthase
VRILHCTWEYPPVIYGGLGRHVHALAESQARQGHDVVVLTQYAPHHPVDERVNGVRILRVPPDAPIVPLDEAHLLTWVASFESALTRGAIALARQWRADVVHGHDWMVAHTASAVRDLMQAPLVMTMHATEAGRHQGWLPSDLSRTIHGVEWWATYQAQRVIVCSEHMRWEVDQLFATPRTKTVVIPNGVDLEAWQVSRSAIAKVRATYGRPLIVYTGRLEWEKGVHTLIDALYELRREPWTAVIAGRGSKEPDLRGEVRRRRLGRRIHFAGWLPELEVRQLVAAADTVVVPSIYEPFGIVALEAAAAGAPLVVAASGGLAEVVEDPVTGRSFEPGDARSLAAAVRDTITHPGIARRRARELRLRVASDFGWPTIAEQTIGVYQQAARVRVPGASARQPDIPTGNLLGVRDGT